MSRSARLRRAVGRARADERMCDETGAWGDANTVGYAVGAAGFAVVATALIQVLLRTTPRAISFFQWIMMLLVVIAVVLPLSLDASLDTRIATAVLNLVLGWTITAMVSGNASPRRRAWRRVTVTNDGSNVPPTPPTPMEPPTPPDTPDCPDGQTPDPDDPAHCLPGGGAEPIEGNGAAADPPNSSPHLAKTAWTPPRSIEACRAGALGHQRRTLASHGVLDLEGATASDLPRSPKYVGVCDHVLGDFEV
ncbi:DUF6069 family protein [Saccharopolyspora mangrovi]|uniref:DUF6069 family protein n=1 Tax=Saccharopolyspora mangrovi TaxID=3082379 RepID=A0ABU6A4S3_9PSEU|nr:DUF6069 family protein [Saccharopolyspora sp. S2-29]MEB3366565.1 DUF6069 family protein [Saccharopolyspora sp. S2-29]